LSASQHIVVLADNQTFLLDYRGKIFATIPVIAECVANWGDGFLLAKENSSTVFYYRFEDQKYVEKFEY
jgi:hypothetical protein